jgi:hypothetical protein
MPDLQDSAVHRSRAVSLEKQTRAFFTRFAGTRQVPQGAPQLLQNPRVGGKNGHCAGAGFWLGLGQFIDRGVRFRTSRRRRGQLDVGRRVMPVRKICRYGDPVA